jgi:hypothetical protein
MAPSKPKKVGRPKLPKGEAKGKIVALRFNVDDLKRVEVAAKSSNESVSEWMRRSLEEAQVVKLMVRITDKAENKFDWFIGPPQECPPLPRIGEHLDCGFGDGTVRRIEHAVEEIDTNRVGGGKGPWNTYYKILILIGP